MSTITNNQQVKFALWTSTLEAFESANKYNNIIYFIANEQKLYLDGVYYGISETELTQLSNSIGALASIIAEPIKVGWEDKENGTIKQGPTGNQGDYNYTTIGPALKYLDEQLEIVKGLTGTQSVANQLQAAINNLDADFQIHVDGTQAGGVQSGYHVGIQVSEVDGVITNVQLHENDIASAATVSGHQTALQTLNGDSSTEGSIAKSIEDAKTVLKGTQGTDNMNAETIAGAKAYADVVAGQQGAQAQAAAIAAAEAKVNELAGTDWTAQAGTVKAIIDELSDGGNAEFTTFIDKVRGDYSYGNAGEQSVKGYIDYVTAGAQSAGIQAATNAQNGAQSYTDTQIEGLDATVSAHTDGTQASGVQSGHFVGVQVIEEDGKLTGVQVMTNDIASALGVQTSMSGLDERVKETERALTWTIYPEPAQEQEQNP